MRGDAGDARNIFQTIMRDLPLRPPRDSSLVDAECSRQIAQAHLAGTKQQCEIQILHEWIVAQLTTTVNLSSCAIR